MRLDVRIVRAAAPQSGRAAQGAEALCYALLRHVRSACAAPDNVWLAARLVAALAPAAQWLARAPELAQCTAYMLLRCARARVRAAARAAPCLSVLRALLARCYRVHAWLCWNRPARCQLLRCARAHMLRPRCARPLAQTVPALQVACG